MEEVNEREYAGKPCSVAIAHGNERLGRERIIVKQLVFLHYSQNDACAIVDEIFSSDRRGRSSYIT